MAIWFMDGFDHYTDDTYGAGGAGTVDTYLEMHKKWTNYITAGNHVISPFYARQRPGQGVFLQATCSEYKTRPAGSVATMFGGCAVLFTTFNTVTTIPILYFIDGTTEQCSVRLDVSAHITFNRGSTVLATSSNTISLNTWYYVEAKATIHNTTGQYEVRVDGTSTGWIAQSSADKNTRATANNYATGMAIGNPANVRHDDVYFGDTTGSNADFLGDVVVYTLYPSSAGNYAQWTPNYGANFGNVNEIYPDFDLTFNQSSTANQIDSFGIQNLPIASGIVYAVQETIYAKRDAGAARSIAPFLRVNGTDSVGTTATLSTSYAMVREVWDVNPEDSAAWTIADVNETEAGYKLIS